MVLLALSLGLPQGVTVLCAGPGGHLAVEFAGVPEADAGGCDCSEECGPCQDVQVGIGDAMYRPAPSLQADGSPTIFSGPVPEVAVAAVSSPAWLAAGPIRSSAPFPPILGSVVLLI